jgi:hypothetical protein
VIGQAALVFDDTLTDASQDIYLGEAFAKRPSPECRHPAYCQSLEEPVQDGVNDFPFNRGGARAGRELR